MKDCDFTGWATRYNIRCSDGRTITSKAFEHQNGARVPLIWGHNRDDINSVLGYAILEHEEGNGMRAYGFFNNSKQGQQGKEAVGHGDIGCLSICANKLQQNGGEVVHGEIREVSLVLAGANSGAYIDNVIRHGEELEDEAYIQITDDYEINLNHGENIEEDDNMDDNQEQIEHADDESEKTIQDVIDTMSEEQKRVLYALVGNALGGDAEDDENDSKNSEGGNEMRHSVFDNDEGMVLEHDDMKALMSDVTGSLKRCGSLKDAFLEHADAYGIQDIGTLFPEPHMANPTPEFIKRDTDWVGIVMNGVHHTPFSRIKSRWADITEDEARAKGYIKGKLKKEEVFSLLKRTTQPTTVYKKQKFDRDDVIDITDFDVIAWIKAEMRMMLNEELARAFLIGDGRLASDDDKIDENCIRPICNEPDLFTIRWSVAQGDDDDAWAKNVIRCAVKARKNYRGSGNPIMFTTEDFLTAALLLEDTQGYRIYKTEAELATAMRVSKIVTVPVLEDAVDKDGKTIYAIILNLADYNVGADKGGAVSMFDDFDIDYNQMKYLIETRCSSSLVKPFSAIVLRSGTANASEEPTIREAIAEVRAAE